MVPPPKADSGQSTAELRKTLPYSAAVVTSPSSHSHAKKNNFSVTPPDRQGMNFVSHYIRNNDDDLLTIKKRSEGPFTIIDSVLNHYGLPLQLKYLAVIESELKPSALSRVGARGPWQLMPGTAHELGLKVNHRSDERTNYYKSTRAAAKYLKDLHREFGDWLLVLAAYNGGPLPVYRAIHRSHSKNFWTLQNYLPAESRMHVKRFIATAYYFERADSVATTVTQTKTTASLAQTTPYRFSAGETPDEKFTRLMKESATSLKTSHELLTY
jgi:membrane-bound lytic murein transglycosylase D